MEGLAYYSSPIGELRITSTGARINGVDFFDSVRQQTTITPVIEQCLVELDEYFTRGRKFFAVDLHITGSPFQKSVWNELLTIPYGRTISYLDLALRIGDINSVRAVGLAIGQNPLAVLIPCHRVIGKDGELVGYGGGIDRKVWLLQHEGAFAEQLKLF